MDGNPALEERFVLFFDFLGASHAARNWPRERVHQFVDLLIAIARVQATEAISGEAQPDGSYKFSITPEITTFSDNVVVSYPTHDMNELSQQFESSWTDIVCQDCIRILSGVAEMALRIGLLIRGGLSFGQLYHNGDVVFGEAMVDAYVLESKVAVNPRIVVSERVLAKLRHNSPEDTRILLRDVDGHWHLNYFGELARQAAPAGPDATARAMRWKNAHLELVSQNINELSPSEPSRAAKWEWFRDRFEKATGKFMV